MKKILKKLIAILILLSSHFYICWNLSGNDSFTLSPYSILISFIGTIMLAICSFQIRLPYSLKNLAYAFLLWFAFVYAGIIGSFVAHMLQIARMVAANEKRYWVLLITVLIFGYGYINAKLTRISSLSIKLRHLKSPLKIAHLSDLHLGCAYGKPFVKKLCKKLKALKPDFVVITGDLYDGNTLFEYDTIEPFDQLEFPIYFILGNHDLLYPAEVLAVLKKSKMIFLHNSTADFREDVRLIGFDFSHSHPSLKDQLKKVELNPSMTNILLYHEPSFDVDELPRMGISLYLAGHTHGGQLFPAHLLQMMHYKYLSGLYSSKDKAAFLHVSQGVGTTGCPLRIGTVPTITLLALS